RQAPRVPRQSDLLGEAKEVLPVLVVLLVEPAPELELEPWAEEREGLLKVPRHPLDLLKVPAHLVVDVAVPVCQEDLAMDACLDKVVDLEADEHVPEVEEAGYLQPDVVLWMRLPLEELPQVGLRQYFLGRRPPYQREPFL